MVWLLGRGYTEKSALKLVGDRYALVARQREAIRRGVCTPTQAAGRVARRTHDIAGRRVAIDGFNQLITVEAAMAGGICVVGVDGCLRDMASVHGNYRRVEQTHRALEAMRAALEQLRPATVLWLFDRPISNSGRVASWVRALDREAGPWTAWEVRCVDNPDKELVGMDAVVASADAWVIDHAAAHLQLAASTLSGATSVIGTESWLDLRGAQGAS